MNVSMSLVDVGILKSIGPDQKKLENTLEIFGTDYRYLVFGYPPFVKSFVDTTRLDLKKYEMDLIVGGEGLSEGLRTYLLEYFRTVISSYGASDLEINIGVETEMTVNLRRLCIDDAELSKKLFGRETPPMIFQYNPLDYIVETSNDKELVFTIGRQDSAAPKLRYNLHDVGGTLTYKELKSLLNSKGVDILSLAKRQSNFPILYVFGRSDLTAPFYGAKIYPTDVEEIINYNPVLTRNINCHQIVSYEDDAVNKRLKIRLETASGVEADFITDEELHKTIFEGLCRVNQDFREVTKMFDPSAVEIELFPYGTGPFAERDIRIKNKYINSE